MIDEDVVVEAGKMENDMGDERSEVGDNLGNCHRLESEGNGYFDVAAVW